MRKIFVLLCITVMAMGISWAQADAPNLPQGVVSELSTSFGQSYEIGRVNYGEQLQAEGSYACYYYDQRGHAAAFVLMHSDAENVLCIFEKQATGEWYLLKQSADAVLQNGRIPLITAETYDQFVLSYLDDERQSDLDLTFQRQSDGWYLRHISTVDGNKMGVSIDVSESKLVFTQESDAWQETIVERETPCRFEQFHVADLPLSVEAAKERPASTDAP